MQDYERKPIDERDRRPVEGVEQVHVTTRDRLERERAVDDSRRLELALPEALNIDRDRVRWGPIWAGVLAALTTLLLMSALGIAIGLTAINAGAAAAEGAPPAGTGTASAVWGSISAIVAFLVGGFVAGRTSAVFDRNWGAWNGALVFMLALPLTLLLASQGLGMLVGALSNFSGALNINPGDVTGAGGAAPNVSPADVARAAETARNAALGTLAAIILGVASGAIGGALGTRRTVDLDRTDAELRRS